jgi:hypothetical protein
VAEERSLQERLRALVVLAAAEGLAAVDRMNKSVGAADGAPSTERRRPAISTSRIGDFVGDVVSLGLDQIEGLLEIHGRYADDLAKWYQDTFFPTPERAERAERAERPEPRLLRLEGQLGREAAAPVIVRNDSGRSARASFTPDTRFRRPGSEGDFEHEIRFTPASFQLEPGAHEVVLLSVFLDPARFDEGRYVADVNVCLDDRVVQTLVLDLNTRRPAEAP